MLKNLYNAAIKTIVRPFAVAFAPITSFVTTLWPWLQAERSGAHVEYYRFRMMGSFLGLALFASLITFAFTTSFFTFIGGIPFAFVMAYVGSTFLRLLFEERAEEERAASINSPYIRLSRGLSTAVFGWHPDLDFDRPAEEEQEEAVAEEQQQEEEQQEDVQHESSFKDAFKLDEADRSFLFACIRFIAICGGFIGLHNLGISGTAQTFLALGNVASGILIGIAALTFILPMFRFRHIVSAPQEQEEQGAADQKKFYQGLLVLSLALAVSGAFLIFSGVFLEYTGGIWFKAVPVFFTVMSLYCSEKLSTQDKAGPYGDAGWRRLTLPAAVVFASLTVWMGIAYFSPITPYSIPISPIAFAVTLPLLVLSLVSTWWLSKKGEDYARNPQAQNDPSHKGIKNALAYLAGFLLISTLALFSACVGVTLNQDLFRFVLKTVNAVLGPVGYTYAFNVAMTTVGLLSATSGIASIYLKKYLFSKSDSLDQRPVQYALLDEKFSPEELEELEALRASLAAAEVRAAAAERAGESAALESAALLAAAQAETAIVRQEADRFIAEAQVAFATENALVVERAKIETETKVKEAETAALEFRNTVTTEAAASVAEANKSTEVARRHLEAVQAAALEQVAHAKAEAAKAIADGGEQVAKANERASSSDSKAEQAIQEAAQAKTEQQSAVASAAAEAAAAREEAATARQEAAQAKTEQQSAVASAAEEAAAARAEAVTARQEAAQAKTEQQSVVASAAEEAAAARAEAAAARAEAATAGQEAARARAEQLAALEAAEKALAEQTEKTARAAEKSINTAKEEATALVVASQAEAATARQEAAQAKTEQQSAVASAAEEAAAARAEAATAGQEAARARAEQLAALEAAEKALAEQTEKTAEAHETARAAQAASEGASKAAEKRVAEAIASMEELKKELADAEHKEREGIANAYERLEAVQAASEKKSAEGLQKTAAAIAAQHFAEAGEQLAKAGEQAAKEGEKAAQKKAEEAKRAAEELEAELEADRIEAWDPSPELATPPRKGRRFEYMGMTAIEAIQARSKSADPLPSQGDGAASSLPGQGNGRVSSLPSQGDGAEASSFSQAEGIEDSLPPQGTETANSLLSQEYDSQQSRVGNSEEESQTPGIPQSRISVDVSRCTPNPNGLKCLGDELDSREKVLMLFCRSVFFQKREQAGAEAKAKAKAEQRTADAPSSTVSGNSN
jgi:hypothetical protein